MNRETGIFRPIRTGDETVNYFIPKPLPPDPAIEFTPRIQQLMEEANRALGRLDGLSVVLPDKALFLHFYVRKEALLSSQIEGTQSSFADVLLYELDASKREELSPAGEVSNYVQAMEYGLTRLAEGFPLSLRLLREIHGILLNTGRGSDKTPGEFRISPNWIGGDRPGNAIYVPPPPEDMLACLGDLEKFLHGDMPVLLKAALAHVQFETIHPFLDGNGRLGRLLITFLLVNEGAISDPLLYLSLFFKTNRARYYDLLQTVRTEGNWEEWLEFFLTGVRDTADQATKTASDVLALFAADELKISALGRSSSSLNKIHNLLKKEPYMFVPLAETDLGLSRPTIYSSLKILIDLGIVHESTGGSRYKWYLYRDYLDILREGTEL